MKSVSELQCAESATATTASAGVGGAVRLTGRIAVLVVEDNPVEVKLLRETMRGAVVDTFEMASVGTLADAFAHLDDHRVDVVLLDLSLPDSFGLATVTRLHERRPDVPIVVLSGSDDEVLSINALGAGAQDYLIKGQADVPTLMRALRYAIERSRTEKALAAERDLFNTLMENIPDNIYFKDLQSRFIRVNRGLAQKHNFASPEDAIGKNDFDTFTPEHAQPAFNDEQQIIRTGQPLIGKVEKETMPDGRITWALTTKVPLRDKQGRIIGTFGISKDVTELKQAEAALQRSNQAQEALNALLSVSLHDISLEETLLEVLDRLLAISWLALEDKGGIFLVEGDPSALVLKAQRNLPASLQHACGVVPFGRCLCGRVAASGKMEFVTHVDDRHEIHYEGMSPHGHYCMPIVSAGETLGVINLYVKETHRPEPKDSEFLNAVANVVGGVVKRKQAEEQLKQLNADLARSQHELLGVLGDLQKSNEQLRTTQQQLVQAAKLESIGRLAAGVAHEVKNPMAVILMGLGYLAENLPAPGTDVQVILREMRDAVERADAIVRELLDFSAPSRLELTEENLGACALRALGLVKYELSNSKIRVTKKIAPQLPALRMDRLKIEQVFVNLMMNAIHAMPNGGELTIAISARTATDGETVVAAEIEDTGLGITEDALQKIYDPFFTTKPAGKGSGLGLAVAKGIVESHHGTIHIVNRPEGGVRATLTFRAQ